jgi:hypothetical protein
MLILFDQGTPVPIRPFLEGHAERFDRVVTYSHRISTGVGSIQEWPIAHCGRAGSEFLMPGNCHEPGFAGAKAAQLTPWRASNNGRYCVRTSSL